MRGARPAPGGRTGVHRALLTVVVMMSWAPRQAGGQQIATTAVADTIRVGDVVPIVVRVRLAAGERVLLPDTLPVNPVGAELENAAWVRERVDTLTDGGLEVAAVYSVIPWRPGDRSLPELSVRVIDADGQVRTATATLPTLQVTSVLPADTAGIEPKPPKDVIGRDRAWLPLVLLLLLLATLALAAWWWLRRRRPKAAPIPLAPRTPPREAALATLERARAGGYLARGEFKPFYTLVAVAVRRYAAALDGSWGEDLTTTELVTRFRGQLGPEEARALEAVLRPADRVKFARHMPHPDAALDDWEAAYAWISSFHGPPHVLEAA